MEQLTIIGKSIINVVMTMGKMITPLIEGITESPKHQEHKRRAAALGRKYTKKVRDNIKHTLSGKKTNKKTYKKHHKTPHSTNKKTHKSPHKKTSNSHHNKHSKSLLRKK